jgi:hypothetical protein
MARTAGRSGPSFALAGRGGEYEIRTREGLPPTRKAQLLEAKENLQHMLVSIPLAENERAAVNDGQTAIDTLLARLTDVPTPADSTPRELGPPTVVTMLPIVEVRRGKRSK